MMRACNMDKCSDWTEKSSLFWVPVPGLLPPTFTTTQNSVLTTPNNPKSDFPVTFSWRPAAGIRTGARYIAPGARLCIASPGTSCTATGTARPSSFDDPWVATATVPNAIGSGIRLDVTYFDSRNQIFGFAGQTVNWSAANCWTPPGLSEICVYNNKIEAVTFLP